MNPAIVAANAAAQRTLDPAARRRPRLRHDAVGQQVLAAAMYILPATETKVPMPYGALVQWHRRTEVCGPATPSPTMPFDITGYPAVRRAARRCSRRRTSPWCGRSRWPAGRWPFSRPTSRSWRRP